MQLNPFMSPIAKFIRSNTGPISEYTLLKHLNFSDDDLKLPSESSGDLALFRKHFLVMNALYQLQPIFHDEGYYLVISALKIEIIPHTASGATDNIQQDLIQQSADEKIKAYYLDWDEFTQSDQNSVEQLLNSFWQRYYAGDEKQSALSVLGLDSNAEWPLIRSTYQKLAAKHHPDKGGDSETFISIREAYEQLACLKRID